MAVVVLKLRSHLGLMDENTALLEQKSGREGGLTGACEKLTSKCSHIMKTNSRTPSTDVWVHES